MSVTCDCGFEESFDEAHQPPIIFCPYCGRKGLRFSEESSGRRIDLAQVKALRKANWPRLFGRPMPRYRDD